MKSLTWNQIHGYRLAQHGLSPRLKSSGFVEMTSHLFGLHAQVMSAAELGLGVRTDDLTPQGVQAALWQDRTLVKTWAMRGTLHLLAADDLPLHAAARRADPRGWIDYQSHGITEKQAEAFLEAVPEVLGNDPMTREELAAAVAEHVGLPIIGELIANSRWGTPLKPSAFRGDLCFGPNQGQNVTFVNPKKWLKKYEPVEPSAGFQEIARRYIRTYGPVTPRMFARWWNEGRVNIAKKLFNEIEDELETVEVEGWKAIALRSTLEEIEQSSVSGVIRLLPMFDAYVLDIARANESVLLPQYRKRIFRQQGWTTAVVLVDGVIKGVWDYNTQGTRTAVTVEMFDPPTKSIENGLEAEAEHLEEFFGTSVTLEYGSIN